MDDWPEDPDDNIPKYVNLKDDEAYENEQQNPEYPKQSGQGLEPSDEEEIANNIQTQDSTDQTADSMSQSEKSFCHKTTMGFHNTSNKPGSKLFSSTDPNPESIVSTDDCLEYFIPIWKHPVNILI
jgi:hypothetical protein